MVIDGKILTAQGHAERAGFADFFRGYGLQGLRGEYAGTDIAVEIGEPSGTDIAFDIAEGGTDIAQNVPALRRGAHLGEATIINNTNAGFGVTPQSFLGSVVKGLGDALDDAINSMNQTSPTADTTAPAAISIQNSTPGFAQSTQSTVQAAVTGVNAESVFATNLIRAAQGLPPLPASQSAPTVNVGLASGTLAVAGLGIVALMMLVKRKRGAK